MFESIQQLQELIKSYYIAKRYNQQKANDLLAQINQLRLDIALDAEVRENFYAQLDIPAISNGYQQSKWFSKNDIEYIINRGLANLTEDTTISAVNQGNRQRVITREPTSWQHVFAAVQGIGIGQETLFDFPQEIQFAENEALGLSIADQSDQTPGWIFYHGCTLKETLEEVRVNEIKDEINGYICEPELIPLVFQFPEATAGTLAVNASGDDEIFSSKYDRSLILTHVSVTTHLARLTIIDEGRNQLICQRVEAAGIASLFTNRFGTYYKLPYPHLLRRGDRLRMEALNGSIMFDDETTPDTLQYLNFKGYSL